ncbi:GH92 family glycosyl hydrolase [Labedaea rhizosphaerae]|uniref:Putative alpha-1,2-mannosidase n=1 Tax=Labedaea rhizosphaerae TaxID=598644 RepID=A0A4R6SE39_LABRH|nr:GH92 family glycosyl hydrolase [Labedaea rhizosphaerae]TDP97913.1 putative alpha-1,2-mannosidase [Labedaea rhizosphaerae]
MTIRSLRKAGAAALGLAVLAALVPGQLAFAAPAAKADTDLAKWVNPYVGTKPGGPDQGTGGGAGNTFPGADVPFGMVQWSPDTVTLQHGGYFYDDNRIKGFSLTHLSGAGCSTYQDVPFMPFPGDVTTSPATDPNRYVSKFSHANETVTAGHYAVRLDSGAGADLSVTQRSGIGKFSFPAGKTATMLVNTSGSIAGADDAETVIGRNSIDGWVTSGRFCGADHTYRVYFHATFSQDFAAIGTWKNGAVTPGRNEVRGGANPKADLSVVDAPKTLQAQSQRKPKAQARAAATPADTTVSGPGSGGYVTFAKPDVTMRVGVSFVSLDGAKANLAKESGTKSFDTIAAAARGAWNAQLNKIAVTGGTDAERTTFYTAIYHSLVQPNVFSDVDGRYPGFDGRIHTAAKGHNIYTNFSGWDVYRSQSQLLDLLDPAAGADIATSMVNFAEQGGSWDRWTVANGYTGVMNGDPYHIIVANAYAFGAKDFDAKKALLLMERGATQPTQGYEERPGLVEYMKDGYVPMGADGVWGAGATTLEYTSADFAIAQLANRTGDPAAGQTFMKRAQNWQNLFDPSTAYLRPRNSDGSFTSPFNPASMDGWVEGNGAQYTWMVPYDVEGLVTAMGGKDAVNPRLDDFFTQLNAGTDEPYAFLGNEPTMQTPWLYDYTGAPYKAQSLTRRVEQELYNPTESGLVGNDDLGQMSSWYVWAAMGMYPMIPGRAELVLNSPLFSQVVITRPTGAKITITGAGADTNSPYVTGLKVNGQTTTSTYLPESFVNTGGTVDFQLSSTPDPSWGSKPEDAPPSFRDGEVGQRGYVDPGRLVIPAGGSATANIGAQDYSGKGATVSFTASPPSGFTVAPASGDVVVPAGGKATVPVTVSVSAGTAEGTYRIPISYTGPGGTALSAGALQVLVAEPGSLRAAYNNAGISPDSDQAIANFDQVGWSFSADALASKGVTPGATVTVDGLNHVWPSVPPGEPDNAIASGQTVKLAAPQGATKLAMLGSAANGDTHGTMTITYTDGSTQTADVGFSDWTLGAGSEPVAFNNRVAAQLPYRNAVSGTSQQITTYLFATEPIALDPAKQVASVTLPSSVDGGTLHVFTITAG